MLDFSSRFQTQIMSENTAEFIFLSNNCYSENKSSRYAYSKYHKCCLTSYMQQSSFAVIPLSVVGLTDKLRQWSRSYKQLNYISNAKNN